MARPMIARLRRLAWIIVAPTLFLLSGTWQLQRSVADATRYDSEAASLSPLIARLEAPGMEDRTVAITGLPERYRAPTAAARLRAAQTVLQHNALVARLREGVASTAIAGAALALFAGAGGLAMAAYAARRSRLSRPNLVAAFTTARRLLPLLLGSQVAGLVLALFAVVLFEAAGAWYLDRVDTGALKLIAGAVCIAGLALYLAWLTLRDLANTLAAFTPDPLRVFGRQVTPSAAPGLWQIIAGLAAGQDALMPDQVVVGLHDGFFVTSSGIRLCPDDVPLQGRTLYLSAPDLALLDRDEVAAVIAHELAHFSGEDTAYTQRFLPVYAGIERSLWAIRQGSAAARGSVLLRPAESLGLHVMATFDAAVKHWSRLRELAADQASSLPAGPRAAASALIRTGLIAGVADAVLSDAIQHPQAAPPNLVAAIVQRATATGPGDPGAQLTNTQPHPTDSHPANARRIEALGVAADGILLAHASRPAHAEDTHLRTLFADWTGLCVTLTVDTLTLAAKQDAQLEAVLQTQAVLPADTPTEIYQATRRALLIAGFVGAVLLAAFAGLTYALLTFRTEPASARQILMAVDAGLVAGAAIAALLGAGWHRAGRSPFLMMRPDTLACRDLDRPIPWLTIAGVNVVAAGVHTFLYLVPGTPLPKRIRGWRVRINARRRCVTILGMRPRGMTVQA